jgi:RNA polymerase sigma-70 factor (ECF subfamily)
MSPSQPALSAAERSTEREPTPEAFGELFEQHSGAIYNFCFRRTGDWALAEDLTSVVFLEAWRKRGRVDLITEPPLPWLYGVANNVLRNHSRSLRRFRSALERLPAPVPEPDFADETADRLADERRMRAVLTVIGDLPRREREVLSLCVWAELSYEDAATALDLPVGTIRSRLSRARARLRELVGEESSVAIGGADSARGDDRDG